MGAGPVGLYAAFRLVKNGHSVVVFERDADIAGNVRSWKFVRLFSKLELNMPQDALDAISAAGHQLPSTDEYLTGGEFIDRILSPLAKWLTASGKCDFRIGHEVLSIGRGRLLKGDAIMAVGDKRRVGKPFRILTRTAGGNEAVESQLEVLIDASGSYGTKTANRVGVGGMAAPGEAGAERAGKLRRVIPDVQDPTTTQLITNQRVAVIGTGYSAITCLRNLCDLAKEGRGPSELYWLTRQPQGQPPYSIMADDPLPQRSELAKFGNQLVSGEGQAAWGNTKFEYVPAMAIASMEQTSTDGLRLQLELGAEGEQERSVELDSLFSLTGFHPDMGLWSELQVHMCYASDGPMKLAQTLLAAKVAAEGDPAAAGDCLKQAAPGPQTLENPEPDFYVLGMKSYGRNSSFLMRVGYEQVGLLADKLGASGPAQVQ